MKKSLLFFSCVAVASAVSAQGVAVMATEESLTAAGLSKDKVETAADVVFAEDGSVGSIATAYKDSWGTTTTYKNYRDVKVGDVELTLGSGAVGNQNPVFISFEQGAPTAGAVFKIHSLKNGYMTVFTKINPNKQYIVFEDTDGAMSYTLGYSDGTQTIHYSLPYYETENEDAGIFPGYVDVNAADAKKYFIIATKQSRDANGQLLWLDKDGNTVAGERPVWTGDDGKEKKGAAVMEDIPGQNKPEFPWKVAGLEKAPGESTGFLTFNVYADTDYYFSALGSKAACAGFVFTEENPTVTFKEVLNEDGSVAYPEVVFPAMGYGAAGVENIASEVADPNAPIYNMMGVRVNSDAKGILIQNGKKFIRK